MSKAEERMNKCVFADCKGHALQTEVGKLRKALERIQIWSEAYPLTAFPKPDLKKVAQVLKAAGMTLDAISADAMRHVLDGVKKIVSDALKEPRE